MAQQDEGWPLRLRPLNARLNGVLMRSPEFNGSSLSSNTLFTASPSSSSISSSDLDAQSTVSFLHERSETLGSLIGVSTIMEASRRSTTRVPRRTTSSEKLRDDKRSFKSKHWLFSLCSNLTTDAVTSVTSTPCLAQFLEAERRVAATNTRRNQIPLYYHGPNDYSPVNFSTSNSLFVNGLVAPHQSPAAPGAANTGIRSNNELLDDDGNDFGAPLMFPCLCGQIVK